MLTFNSISHTKNIYLKFLGFLIKKGNKVEAKKILDKTLTFVFNKTKISRKKILLQIFLKLNSFVEVRKIKIKRKTHVVPFSVTLNRRFYLTVKWVTMSAFQNKKRVPTYNKLSQEFLKILLTPNLSNSIKLKTQNRFLAYSNRSNSHFRW